MQTSTHKRIELCLKIVIGIAAIILIALCVLLVHDYRRLSRLDYIAAHGSVFEALRAQGPLGASEVTDVETWMTFDYINHLFALPSQYLQTDLSITSSHYPRLTVAEYAEVRHLEQATFLSQVQNAIREYIAQKQ